MKSTHRGIRGILLTIFVTGLFAPLFTNSIEAKPRIEVRGTIGLRLPNGAISISVGSDRYHYHRGTYYRKGKNGYIVVQAPRGAVIRDLPRNYSRIVVSGKAYYRHGNTYYRKKSGGYIVVATPVIVEKEVIVTKAPADAYGDYEPVQIGKRSLLFKDGQFFRKSSEGLIWVAAPTGALIKKIPVDAISVWYKDIEYFDSDGVYFRKTPDGYRTIEKPWNEDEQQFHLEGSKTAP